MSRSALKKELATFTAPQLMEVILSAYNSSKEAKDYFEFFLNPDADALMEKKIDIIAKELGKSKYGTCKARISHIRKAIKTFENYGVGPEKVAQLIGCTLRMLVGQFRYYNYPDPLLKGTFRLVADYVAYGNAHSILQEVLDTINAIVDERELGTPTMRERVRFEMAAAIAALARKA